MAFEKAANRAAAVLFIGGGDHALLDKKRSHGGMRMAIAVHLLKQRQEALVFGVAGPLRLKLRSLAHESFDGLFHGVVGGRLTDGPTAVWASGYRRNTALKKHILSLRDMRIAFGANRAVKLSIPAHVRRGA